MTALAVPRFVIPRGADKHLDPIMRRAVGALRYDYEVRLMAKADLALLYRDLFNRDQIYKITEYKLFPEVRSQQCPVSWLIKQKEKQHV